MTDHDWNAWVWRENPGGRRLYDAKCSCGREETGYTDWTALSETMHEHLEEEGAA